MERRNNSKISFAISMTCGIVIMAGAAASARPIDGVNASRGCAQAQQILDEFRNDSYALNAADRFELESPLGGQQFQVRWLDINLPAGFENIDPDENDPDTFTQTMQRKIVLDQLRVTLAFAEGMATTDKIDPDENDPDTITIPAAGLSSISVELILFEKSGNHGSNRGLDGCVIWRTPSTDKIDPDENDPDTITTAGNSPQTSWLRFSLPPQIAPQDLDGGHRGREDLLWWLLGLVEVSEVSR